MRNILLLALSATIVSSVSYSQILRRPASLPYVELGTYSSAHTDIFSTTGNKASLARANNITAGLFTERKFMEKQEGCVHILTDGRP